MSASIATKNAPESFDDLKRLLSSHTKIRVAGMLNIL
jgi:hypothetical protein